jgi:hypothetical protein
MYIVVLETIAHCHHKGVITWTSYTDKKAFEKWYTQDMQSLYKVVNEGVTTEEAIQICSAQNVNHPVVLYL